MTVNTLTINDVHSYGTINNVHSYEDDGIYIVTLTVTNNDAGSSSNTVTITVNNLPLIISSIDRETEIEEEELVFYKAIASDISDT